MSPQAVVILRHLEKLSFLPGIRPDLVSVRPLQAGILDFVCETEHSGNAGKRGRWDGRQLPVGLIDTMTCGPAIVLGL